MFELLRGIKFSNALIDTNTEFNLLDGERNLVSMTAIYGKNGSGKSTITKAFSKIIDSNIENILSAELYDTNGETMLINEEMKNKIFIFNEDFIEKNVRLQESGLETIIMFGEQADLASQIEILETKLETERNNYARQNDICKQYIDTKNIKSPQFHWNKMLSILREDKNWAERGREIRGLKQNIGVNELVTKEILSLNPSKTKKELQSEYDKQFSELIHITKEGEKITTPATMPKIYVDEEQILSLLSEKIEQPKLTDRDKVILDLITNGQQNHFITIREDFKNPLLTECPYCLQELSDSYKESIVISVEKVLNQRVDDHIRNLKEAKVLTTGIDFSPFNNLNAEILQTCKDKKEEVDNIVEQYNTLIELKINNIYQPIEAQKLKITEAISDLNLNMNKLEELRAEYNGKFNKVSLIKESLLQLNKSIAYYDLEKDNIVYQKLCCEQNSEEQKLEQLRLSELEKKGELEKLIQKQKSVHIAVDFINRGLQYVFFSNKRLSIIARDDKYMLHSNGKPVKPIDISCGERNILALCYFFTSMMSDINEKDIYQSESLIIIDDPVSSFDLESKVGILSYLKSEFLKIILGNKKSKIIIFSHELATIYDLQKQFEEISKAAKNKFTYPKKYTFSTIKELSNFNLIAFPYRTRNEYDILLQIIYEYAMQKSANHELVIGNIMRRALEAFATFEYKIGIDEISYDQTILLSMEHPAHRDYFENLMYRLILNGESHSETHIKSLQDLNFYSTVSSEEKQRTAKDILCLIYLLNPQHLKAHFKNYDKESIPMIESWCKDILTADENISIATDNREGERSGIL
ncbi:AAA family ATPase [Listeria booriae]|uniref:AAA family ATPase n=1 Tax=Listeria booriae TaxID=1552123 RepID=UPI001627CCDF|nr:AAA family ATPase [Listeria booriae]MBC1943492.1 AAA family ATPase [Listeria booriae]MBC6166002.1 AAA family ATPase [Listeria booriae]